MEKRGLGHIEVILAFVLFAGFLIFALLFFNPLDVDRVVDSSLYYALDEISSNLSVEMKSYSLSIEEGVQGMVIGIPIDNPQNYNIRVENSKGDELNSVYVGANAVFERNAGERFFVIRISEAFNKVGTAINPYILGESEYTISSSEIKDVWSENKALILNSSYYSDYSSLHDEFNLPDRVNFAFILNILDGEEIIAENEIPEGLDVWSESERKETIAVNGEIKFADLTVKIW